MKLFAPPAASDNTDPLTPLGGFSEQAQLLWETAAAVMEQVEVLSSSGQPSDRFLRLSFSSETALAAALRGLLPQLSEGPSGFRDLLLRPGYALAAGFHAPDLCLSQLEDSGWLERPLLRLGALLAGMDEVAGLLSQLAAAGYGWPRPRSAGLGLRRQQSYAPAGHLHWQLQFTAWDQLAAQADTDAAALAGLLLPACDWLLASDGGNALSRATLQQLRSRLAGLALNSELTLTQLRAELERLLESTWTLAGASDTGMRRQHNEDAYLMLEHQQYSAFGSRLLLAAVADGMGGHSSGEVASSLALDLLRMQLTQLALPPRSRAVNAAGLGDDLRSAVLGTGRALLERAALDPAQAGMGTTLVGLAELAPQSSLVAADAAACCIFNIGDSRAYLLSVQGLSRLSTDHSHVQELLDQGQISDDEAFTHPQKNIITRCLGGGGKSEPLPDVFSFRPAPGEILLLCSDGLSDVLRDSELEALIAAQRAPEGSDLLARQDDYLRSLATALIAAANAAGGPDNITLVLVACCAAA